MNNNNFNQNQINEILQAFDLSLIPEDAILKTWLLLNEPDLIEQTNLVLGNNWSYEQTKSLIENLVKGKKLPQLEIVNPQTINGGNGGFIADTNTIYLSREFLIQNADNSDAIAGLLLEEIGHYLDAQLNDTDTSGDEGAIFSAIAQGQELSPSELSVLKAENDTTTVVINGQQTTAELNTVYGNITVDGDLVDWTNNYRLDLLPGTGQPGYEVYGKLTGDAYVFAIKSDGTAIGSGTTGWLNTDQDNSTGYQIFGFAGGAEYNVNLFTDNQPYLYTGAAGENFVTGALDHTYDANQQVVEFAIPVSLLNTSAQEINVLADVNNQVFLPGDYTNQYTASAIGNSIVEPPVSTGVYDNITLDGDLSDWTAGDRLLPGTSLDAYKVYGKIAGDAYVFAIESNGTAIGADTTVWLNTDQDAGTGYQIFGFAGGAEYNVNFFTDNQPYLYTGAAGENFVTGALDHVYNNTQQVVEFAVPLSLVNDVTPGVDVLIDVNNQVFLPGDYSNQKYTIEASDPLPPRTDLSKKVGIVFSETTAQNFFSEDAYTQLFLSMQYQAMQAGIPFDLLTEDDLTDINNLVNYDSVIFPSFSNVPLDKLEAIENTLNDAVYNYNIGMITAGDFLTNDETGAALPGDSYMRMKQLLNLNIVGGSGSNGQDITLRAADITHPVTQDYTADEVIRSYEDYFYNNYDTFDQGLGQGTVYDFVGSYYINVGNNPPDQQTDWSISAPYYQELIAQGSEIGTHSYTHPENTNLLSPTALEFEFNQSQLVIEQQLGIDVVGAAIPGAPEGFAVSQELKQYLSYVSGGYSGVGAGYPGAFGFPFAGEDYVYFAPNLSFDFSLIQFRGLSTAEAEAEWLREYNEIGNHAAQAIYHWPWHDYGPTVWDGDPSDNEPAPPYTEELFTNFVARAYNDNTEFVTENELHNRIKTFEQAQLFTETNGNTITVTVATGANNSVGSFGLNVDGAIASVDNWYAYDNDTVFLPSTGGQFTINLGASTANVTRIVDLPMRAELQALNGNGTDLEYTFFGEGQVVLEVANPNQVSIIGADQTSINGNTVQMTFATINQHNARILASTWGDDVIEGAAGQDILVGGQGSDRLNGGQGNDRLVGVDPNSLTPGALQVDRLNGGEGQDTFVLGDGNTAYYNFGVINNILDVAVVEDFNINEDVIQLNGSASNYTLTRYTNGITLGSGESFGSSVGIFTSQREIVALVLDVSNLDLNSVNFQYV